MAVTRERLGIGAREMLSFLDRNSLNFAREICGLFPLVNHWQNLPESGVRKRDVALIGSGNNQTDLVIGAELTLKEGTRTINERYGLFCKLVSGEDGVDLTKIDISAVYDRKSCIYTAYIIVPRGTPLSSYSACNVKGCMARTLIPNSDGSLALVKDELRELARLAG